MTKRIIAALVLALAIAVLLIRSNSHPAEAAPIPPRTVFVQLFEWRWADVARECETYLGPKGFSAVQISPPHEHLNIAAANYPWWERYQVVSYAINSRSGDRAAFSNMVQRCHAAGVEVYADAVINHMSGYEGAPSWGGSTWTHYEYPGTYSGFDFHYCGTAGNEINNYADRWNVQNCELVNLADLKTEATYVRDRIRQYLQDLLSLGVDGFRIDASKHIPASDLSVILSGLTKTNGQPPYIFQEVIESSSEPIQGSEYFPTGDVTEFDWGREVNRVFTSGTLNELQNFTESKPGFMGSQYAVTFVDNHDTQRGGGVLTYKNTTYTLAAVFELAWPYGYPVLMSSFDFTNTDAGPPGSGGNTNWIYDSPTDTTPNCGGSLNWVCEHRWTAIGNMVGFRNYTNRNFFITNWWSNGSQAIAFGRGNAGYVVLNKETSAISRTFQTSLPAGTYCNVIVGQLNTAGTGCTGTSITVNASGQFTATVNPNSAIAIHDGQLVTTTPPPTTPPPTTPPGGNGQPWPGPAVNLPGTVQAENFNSGGPGVAYNDTDAANTGGQYRTTEQVDIEATTDTGGGYNVGWTRSGEWMKYTVNVTTAGTYTITFRVASAASTGAFYLEVDGTNVTGTMTTPNTGGWQTYSNLTRTGVNLTAGTHVLRLVFTGNDTNLNSISFSTTSTPPPTTPPPVCTPVSCPGGTYVCPVGTTCTGGCGMVCVMPTTPAPTTPPPTTPPPTTPPPTTPPPTTPPPTTPPPTTPPGGNGSPCCGGAVSLPGTVQAENFNTGGEGVAYHDNEAANNGGQYRTTEGVDIEITSDTGGGYDVGWAAPGEWRKHTVTVSSAGTYDIGFRVASGVSTGSFYLEVDGTNVTGTMTTPNTGGWQNWQTITRTGVNLTAGSHVLRYVAVGDGTNLNWISFTKQTSTNNGSPWGGTPAPIPGTVQAENYNTGGEGIAYHDLETANQGGQYRTTEGVDIEGTSDTGGGYHVGWTRNGEWLKWTVNATAAGTRTIDFRVASGATTGSFYLEIDGVNVTGTMTVPNTGGWQTFQTISRTGISISAGQHVFRLVITGNDTNINWIQVR